MLLVWEPLVDGSCATEYTLSRWVLIYLLHLWPASHEPGCICSRKLYMPHTLAIAACMHTMHLMLAGPFRSTLCKFSRMRATGHSNSILCQKSQVGTQVSTC